MKKILSIIFMFFMVVPLFGQNQWYNLEKYWRYRAILRDRFIVVSPNVEEQGVNIPASEIFYDNEGNKINWGDGNSNMSHYLSVLATELWLLKNNHQDYSTTLKELYYAMLAMERLDFYSEKNFRIQKKTGNYIDLSTDINGFHSRDDVSEDFWSKYSSHFPATRFVSCYSREDANGNKKDDIYDISQDNTFHNLEGLALIAKLVGTENVGNIPVTFQNNYIPNYLTSKGIKNGNSVNFSLWAKDFTKRYIKYVQNSSSKTFNALSTHWYLENSVLGRLNEDGNGNDLDLGTFYHYGLVKAGEFITGENLRLYDGIVSTSATKSIYEDLFTKQGVKISNLEKLPIPLIILLSSTGYALLSPFFLADPITAAIIWLAIKDIYVSFDFDNYKLSTLACTGNIMGKQTFHTLRHNRDNYNGPNAPYMPVYEHFPLIYAALNSNFNYEDEVGTADYEDDMFNLYEFYLDYAESSGCWSYSGLPIWTSTSRLVWPENVEKNKNKNIQFSGLDYMLLHNLFYIAFRREDFTETTVPCSVFTPSTVRGGKLVSSCSPVSSNAKYIATNSVTLKPGFSVAAGKKFTAKIEPHSHYYQGHLYKEIKFDANGHIMQAKRLHNETEYTEEDFIRFEKFLLKMQSKMQQKQEEETIMPNDIDTENEIQVFPNPTTGKIYVLTNAEKVNRIEIKNLQGITILQSNDVPQTEIMLDISVQPAGIYFLTVQTENGVQIFKVVKN